MQSYTGIFGCSKDVKSWDSDKFLRRSLRSHECNNYDSKMSHTDKWCSNYVIITCIKGSYENSKSFMNTVGGVDNVWLGCRARNTPKEWATAPADLMVNCRSAADPGQFCVGK